MTPPAVVFDLDGVLLDSETAWTRAETRLFERYGRTYGADEKRLLIGGPLGETAEELERLLAPPWTAPASTRRSTRWWPATRWRTRSRPRTCTWRPAGASALRPTAPWPSRTLRVAPRRPARPACS